MEVNNETAQQDKMCKYGPLSHQTAKCIEMPVVSAVILEIAFFFPLKTACSEISTIYHSRW